MSFFLKSKLNGRAFTRNSVSDKRDKGKAASISINERAHVLDATVIADKLRTNLNDGLDEKEADNRLEE